MDVIITRKTDMFEVMWAFNTTSRSKTGIKIDDWRKPYKWEHSPIRAEIYRVELVDIETAISEQILRHSVGVLGPWITTGRDDRGGDADASRTTPRNHGLLVSAEWFINIAKKRLCNKAHRKCREVVQLIKKRMEAINPDLSDFMVPQCVYRGGMCQEPKPCGHLAEIVDAYAYYFRMFDRVETGNFVKGEI